MIKLKNLIIRYFTGRDPELDPVKCGTIAIYTNLKPVQLKNRIFRLTRDFEVTAFNKKVIGRTKDYDKINDILMENVYVPLSSYSLLFKRRTLKKNMYIMTVYKDPCTYTEEFLDETDGDYFDE